MTAVPVVRKAELLRCVISLISVAIRIFQVVRTLLMVKLSVFVSQI